MFSLIGYVCLLIVGVVVGLWIYTADGSKSYEEVRQQYQSYFPGGAGKQQVANCYLYCFTSDRHIFVKRVLQPY